MLLLHLKQTINCNSLLYGCRKMHLKELLIICSEHCPQDRYSDSQTLRTHHLFDFHWLPVSYHVVFKLFSSVFKSLNNLPPSYLADIYRRPSRNLWSASQQLLEQPRKLTGKRLFQCAPLNCGTHYH